MISNLRSKGQYDKRRIVAMFNIQKMKTTDENK